MRDRDRLIVHLIIGCMTVVWLAALFSPYTLIVAEPGVVKLTWSAFYPGMNTLVATYLYVVCVVPVGFMLK